MKSTWKACYAIAAQLLYRPVLILFQNNTCLKLSVMKTQDYYSLIEKSIHKEYKKSDEGTFEAISQGDKVIAEKLDIADRVFKTTKQPAFGTVKDH